MDYSDGILQLSHLVKYNAEAISPRMNVLQSRVSLPEELTHRSSSATRIPLTT
ncbi:hypothetical protein Tco_1567658, partial [Tanacetum coccineum]